MRCVGSVSSILMRMLMLLFCISMRIKVDETLPTHRILSRVEQYQQLEKRNPALKMMTELFNLDLE